MVLISVVERERYTRNGTTRSVFSGTGTSTACSERFSPKSGWVCEPVCASVSNGKPVRGNNGNQEGGGTVKLKKQESSVHIQPHTRRVHVCMHVLHACVYPMYVLYVCALCLHSIYAHCVCTLCIYSMYVLHACAENERSDRLLKLPSEPSGLVSVMLPRR